MGTLLSARNRNNQLNNGLTGLRLLSIYKRRHMQLIVVFVIIAASIGGAVASEKLYNNSSNNLYQSNKQAAPIAHGGKQTLSPVRPNATAGPDNATSSSGVTSNVSSTDIQISESGNNGISSSHVSTTINGEPVMVPNNGSYHQSTVTPDGHSSITVSQNISSSQQGVMQLNISSIDDQESQ